MTVNELFKTTSPALFAPMNCCDFWQLPPPSQRRMRCIPVSNLQQFLVSGRVFITEQVMILV